MRKILISMLALVTIGMSTLGMTSCDFMNKFVPSKGGVESSVNESENEENNNDLIYLLSEDKMHYSVTDIGSYTATDLVIPSVYQGLPVEKIDAYAFYNCIRLTSVAIPDGVTRICGLAFSGCSSLKSVVIPKSVTWIGGNAFSWCNRLTSIRYEGTMAEWAAIGKGDRWNYRMPAKEVICSDGNVSLK